jgi:cytosine/adenosine deaminase-related metal-dependent hydrolase
VTRRLLSAPWVLPIAGPPLREGAVELDGDVVVSVGPRPPRPGIPEERGQGALLPGLVNAHTHLELSALAGHCPGGAGLVGWATALTALPRPLGVMRVAAGNAVRAAVAAGTAGFGDVGNSLLAVPALAGRPALFFHELLGSREARTGDALADAARERNALGRWPARIGYVPAPHAPYSVGPELFRRIFAAAARTGLPTSVHVAEDRDELALLLKGTGPWVEILARMGVPPGSRSPRSRPVPYLASLGAFDGPRPPLLVHMVHAGEEDRALASRHGATVVLCPRSNQHVSGQLPDVPALIADGVRLAIGTDSLASSPDLSLWGELRALAAAFPAIPASTWLTAATTGGAAALGLDALGTLAAGKRPGVLAVSLPDPTDPWSVLHARTVHWMAHP